MILKNFYLDSDISDWLNEDYSEDYKNTIKSIIPYSTNKQIRDFFKGHLQNFRHSKGMALSLSWLEVGLKDCLKTNELNSELIIECAKNHLKRIQDINLRSFNNILSTYKNVSVEIEKYNFKSIKPDYYKWIIYSMLQWKSNNSNNEDSLIPLAIIEPSFKDIKNIFNIPSKNRYGVFSSCIKCLNDFPIKQNIFEKFGLRYDKDKQAIFILTNEILKKYVEIFNVDNVDNVDDNVNNNKNTNVDNVDNVEQIPILIKKPLILTKKSTLSTVNIGFLGNKKNIIEELIETKWINISNS